MQENTRRFYFETRLGSNLNYGMNSRQRDRYRPLIRRLLNVNHQHAFMSGKLTDSTLHQLTTNIERTLDAKEMALCSFLDIEGARDF